MPVNGQAADAGSTVGLPVAVAGRAGYIRPDGRLLVPPKYDSVSEFRDGLGAVCLADKWGYVDGTGAEAIPIAYDWGGDFAEGLAPVKEARMWGYLDRKGARAIPFTFEYAYEFCEGIARVQANGRIGYVDRGGRYVIAPRFPDPAISDPSEGMVAFCDPPELWTDQLGVTPGRPDGPPRGRWGYMDIQGIVVVPPAYWGADSFHCGLAYATTDGGVGYLDRAGHLAISLGDGIRFFGSPFCEGYARVGFHYPPGQVRFGYIDAHGTFVCPPRFDECKHFQGGRGLGRKGDRWFFITPSGSALNRDGYQAALPFAEGRAAVLIGGKWGFIDSDARVVVAPAYDRAWSYHSGIARVQRLGKCAFIDKNGNPVTEFAFDPPEEF